MDDSSKMSIIYTSLMLSGILVSTIFSLLLSYSPYGFIVLICLYVMGYSIYMFVLMMINRKRNEGDTRMQVAVYVTLFNMLFTTALFLFSVMLKSKIKRSMCY